MTSSSPAQVPDRFFTDGRPGLDPLLLLPGDLVNSGPDSAIQDQDLAPEQTLFLFQ